MPFATPALAAGAEHPVFISALRTKVRTDVCASICGKGPFPPLWQKGYGKLFWFYYIGKTSPTTKDLWRALVPLSYEVDLRVTASWPNGKVWIRPYLYPWGIGLVADIAANGLMDLDEAVKFAFDIRKSLKFRVAGNQVSPNATLTGLIDLVFDHIRTAVYGADITKGQKSELFSIVTVLDADGAVPVQAITNEGDIHRALEAMTGWNPLYKSIELTPLAETAIPIKKSPPGHVLYGGRRGRVVWFPGNFSSVAPYVHTLSCYHKNLTMASLQTESLCRLATDAADALATDLSLANFSVDYRDCAKLAAGTLGRLYGGMFDTYRSNSIRDQIQRMYKDAVNVVRKHYDMMPLNP